ncbi:DUF29 domain-containing protein [Azospirillum picis]|uniref:DUF29 domain-containing protein n=1 Tax=Azospirillum picis TaxID=488438 RepID=A0ABU0MEX6_9PROT|nr:DUF29 domain-containing protein [Azospirillum picis]MBP2298111.1 hypothetical protein [Azospirillum picis]MDQ0531949.1 hypothetical protein [Azospirillum picis]
MDGRAGYDTDLFAWTGEQARLLRDAAQSRPGPGIDWDHIAGELDAMGAQVRDAVRRHLAAVIENLLKLEYSPDPRPRRRWWITATKARRHLEEMLEENPSLQRFPAEILEKAWLDGDADACLDDGIDIDALPKECPYALEDLRDPDWWPVNRHGLT